MSSHFAGGGHAAVYEIVDYFLVVGKVELGGHDSTAAVYAVYKHRQKRFIGAIFTNSRYPHEHELCWPITHNSSNRSALSLMTCCG